MKRMAAVVIALGAVVGLLDPFACRQYSMGAADTGAAGATHPNGAAPAAAAPSRPLPRSAKAHLLDTAKRAMEMIPTPGAYVSNDDLEAKGDEGAPWDSKGSAFIAPGTARAERSFDPGTAGVNPPPMLEQRVFVNSEVAIPTGLASVGGSPKAFDIAGAVAVEVTTITDSEDSQGAAPRDGGRVALPMTSNQKQTAITITRVLLANPKTESAFQKAIATGTTPAWTPLVPKKPGEIQTLVIELYGGRSDVEALARRIPTT